MREKNANFPSLPEGRKQVFLSLPYEGKKRKSLYFSRGKKKYPPTGGNGTVSLAVNGGSSRATLPHDDSFPLTVDKNDFEYERL